MKTLRTRSSAFVLSTLLVTALAWWGCGGSTQGGDSGNATNETPSDTPPSTGQADPATGGEVSLAVGERVFKERCEMCHGASGKGDGPAGMALNPKPRDMTEKSYMTGLTDQQIHDTILNGKAGTSMPPHQGLLNESEVQSAILKVRRFSQS